MRDPIGEKVAAKLTKLQQRMKSEKDLPSRLTKDKESVLKEMGFSPEEIATFRLEPPPDRDSCDCSCAPNKGWGKGCLSPNTDGAVSDP
jgi:hypothetical protein